MWDDLSGPFGSVVSNHRFFLGTAIMSVLMASIATFGVKLKKHLCYLSTRYIITPRKLVPITLSDLPLEIRIQILSLLEWDEVLRARQTCRRLRDDSLARPVWLALFKWYSATVYPRPFCLEKPLDLYTHRELEHLVLRQQKVKVCWPLSQYQNIPIQRHFIAPEKVRNCVYLVEGGRWLLVGTNSGAVLCYDLNASAIEPVLLVPTPFGNWDETEILLSVEMDPDSEYLKFNLAIITRRMPDSASDSVRFFRWIQIWQVTSDIDKHGQALRAEKLACFPEEHRNRCDSFRLCGRQVAYALHSHYEFGDLRDGPCIIVVDWTLSISTSLVYNRKVVWRTTAEWLALLPGNRILCHFFQDLALFDLHDAPMTTLDPSQYHRHLSQIAPVAHISLSADAISQPYFHRNSTRITALTYHGVRGVVIPDSNGSSGGIMECIDLLSVTDIETPYACIGYDRAVLVRYWPELITLKYAWPEDYSCTSVSQKIINWETHDGPHDGRRSNVLFDGGSGRIVLSTNESKKQYLINIGSLQ